MSVLLLEPRATGGLAAHVADEVDALTRAGVETRIAPVQIRERPSPLRDLRTIRELAHLTRRERPAAVHAHGLRAGGLAALTRLHGARLVVTLHNLPVGSRAVRWTGAALLRLAARRADVILAVSPDLADAARHAGARDVRHALIPGPATSTRPARLSAEGSPLEILVLARLAPQKDLDTFLDAIAKLRADGVSVHARIAGDGPLREHLQERITAEDLPVELIGHRGDVPELLVERPLVVSSARWEGQPVGLQQALAAGCPIVATDAGGTRWVTGRAASLVPVADPAGLAAAIAQMTDPAVRARAAQASLERADELPTREQMTRQLIDVLMPRPDAETQEDPDGN